jgi:hypothetical protein
MANTAVIPTRNMDIIGGVETALCDPPALVGYTGLGVVWAEHTELDPANPQMGWCEATTAYRDQLRRPWYGGFVVRT